MERTKKAVDLFAPWMTAQQTFWEPWRAAMEGGMPSANPMINLWGLALETWKAAIYEGLDMELIGAEIWKGWVCTSDAHIPEISEGACQAAHFVEDWTQAQMQLWDGWFAAMEKLAPGTATRPATAAPAAAKPRAHERTRQHDTPAHARPHNGVPA